MRGAATGIFATGEVVSAQTVSKVTRSLDRLVKAFQQARLKDEWAYLFLDGVSLRVRRLPGRQRVQMLVAYIASVASSKRDAARGPGSASLMSLETVPK